MITSKNHSSSIPALLSNSYLVHCINMQVLKRTRLVGGGSSTLYLTIALGEIRVIGTGKTVWRFGSHVV
ncbi:hypothetical protein OUZ56_004234 [Daphnia magna]|uniref:Uncharacterized protein n=1 Tax=Daphnia magna TaxID=35525 RepID=A0ABQ9YP67_9CRUS|nr:hypothetical protein OUZ56_004234 [Daphnia magna]